MSVRKTLIIIPGLGDRTGLYRLAIPIWKLLNYDVHIFSFGWEDNNENFDSAIKRLADYLDDLQAARVNIIGASAGGTVAINALALRPDMVKKVVTVATPYEFLSNLKNTKLKTSINHLTKIDISHFRPNLLSLYGLYDQTVPAEISRPKGVRTRKVYAVNHGCIIAVSLTVYSTAIRKFFEV